jgi:predicted secreted protein
MKTTAKFIAINALLISTGAVFSQNIQATTPSQRVTLSASASVQIPQDVLTLSLTTQREGPDAQTVQNLLKVALDAALVQSRRDTKDAKVEVSTGRFGVSPRYDRNGKVSGWQGTAELVLQGRDFARMGEVAGKLQTLTVANASFGLTPEQRQTAEAQAQGQAIARFRQQASDAAKSFGLTGYSLVEAHINAGDAGGGRPPMLAMSSRAMASSEAPVPIEAGLSVVVVTVSGTVQLN